MVEEEVVVDDGGKDEVELESPPDDVAFNS